MNTISVFTEGGSQIGLGHVRRCLVIARELKRRGNDILFLVNNDHAAIQWIEREGFPHKIARLTEPLLPDIDTLGSRFVLIDTKKPVSGLIRSLKKNGYATMLLDNLTDARLEADSVVYPTAIYEDSLDWTGFKGKVFGGPEYVPIAESFIKARANVRRKNLQPPYKVLVTMGGSDPNHLTGRVVSALQQSLLPLEFKVVIGPAFSFDPLLDDLEAQDIWTLQCITNSGDLSSVMAESDIALTALGTTIFELACMGIPSLLIANYRTDEPDMTAFGKLGICLPLGYREDVADDEIRHAAESLLRDETTWGDMSQKGESLVDGKGAERIARIVEDILRIPA